MTTIAAYRNGDNVWMAGDRQATANGHWRVEITEPKVYKRGDWLVGVAANILLVGVLCGLQDEGWPLADSDDDLKKLREWALWLKKHIVKRGAAEMEDGEHVLGGSILLARKDGLFQVTDNFGVENVANCYHAIGSGTSFALGAMCALENRPDITPYAKVEAAVEAAEFHSCETGFGVDIISSLGE